MWNSASQSAHGNAACFWSRLLQHGFPNRGPGWFSAEQGLVQQQDNERSQDGLPFKLEAESNALRPWDGGLYVKCAIFTTTLVSYDKIKKREHLNVLKTHLDISL